MTALLSTFASIASPPWVSVHLRIDALFLKQSRRLEFLQEYLTITVRVFLRGFSFPGSRYSYFERIGKRKKQEMRRLEKLFTSKIEDGKKYSLSQYAISQPRAGGEKDLYFLAP
jgi:hypothetical protein